MNGDDDRKTLDRREALGALLVATAAGCALDPARPPRAQQRGPTMQQPTARMPAVYLPHGGGPWPWMRENNFGTARERQALTEYLTGLLASFPRRPTAMLVVSAHWEAPAATVQTHPNPPILYDYSGFPEETYQIPWPAPGSPRLAARVRSLLTAAGFPTAEDPRRGFDHGTFVPLKLAVPNADIPTVQLSLLEGLDPARHLALGRALAPLRDEGILLVGSGMSYHNLRGFFRGGAGAVAEQFDAWMQRACTDAPESRDAALERWSQAPAAREAHPREEHLLPLMVMAGAAGSERGRVAFSDTYAGARITAIHFGA